MSVAETSIDVKTRRRQQMFSATSQSDAGRGAVGPELNTDPRMMQGTVTERAGNDVIINRTNPLSMMGVGVGMGNNYDDSHRDDGTLGRNTEWIDPSDEMFQTPTKSDEERARNRRLTATPVHVDIVDSSELSKLIAAVKKNDADTVKTLTEDMDLDVLNAVTEHIAWGAMHWAAYLRANKALYALIEAGASCTVQDKRANTPLHWAAVSSNVEGLELLCDADADVHAKNHLEATALHLAARSKSAEAYEFLLSVGGLPAVKDKYGITAEFLARKRGIIDGDANATMFKTPMPAHPDGPKLIGAPPWLHPFFANDKAKAMLQGTPQGTFMVREWTAKGKDGRRKEPGEEFALTVMYKSNISHHLVNKNNNGDWSFNNAKKQEETGCKTLVSLVEVLRGPREGWPIALKLGWPVQLRKAVTRSAAATEKLLTHKVAIGIDWLDEEDGRGGASGNAIGPDGAVVRESSTDTDPDAAGRLHIGLAPFAPFERRESFSDEHTRNAERADKEASEAVDPDFLRDAADDSDGSGDYGNGGGQGADASRLSGMGDGHYGLSPTAGLDGDADEEEASDDELDMDSVVGNTSAVLVPVAHAASDLDQAPPEGAYGSVTAFKQTKADLDRRASQRSVHVVETAFGAGDDGDIDAFLATGVVQPDFQEAPVMLRGAAKAPVLAPDGAYATAEPADEADVEYDATAAALAFMTEARRESQIEGTEVFSADEKRTSQHGRAHGGNDTFAQFDRLMNRGSSKSNAGDVIYDGTGVDALASQSSTRSTQSTPRQLYSEITPNKTRQVAATIRRQEGESFGLNLGGPTTDADIATKGAGFYISKIAAGSPASKTKLKKGFQVIKIQGTDVSSLKFLKDVASVIKAAGNELRVVVADDKSLAEAYGVTFAKQRRRDAFEVTLTKQETDKSFGVKFGGPANYEEAEQLGKGLFISAVMPNTPADRDALLVKNLQILAVNGVDMTACGSLKLDAMPTLKTLTSSMTLKLKPNASLAKTYNNHRKANNRA